MIMLLAAMLMQRFLLNAPFKQYAAEFISFSGMFVYMIVRYMTLGLDIYGDEKRAKAIPIINSVVAGIVVTVTNGVLNYSKYTEHYKDDAGFFLATLAITFISVTVFTFAVLSCVSYVNKKRQAQILKRLDDEERDE
jgi:uncharacterized membrane protein YbjE (DUF340 family)